MTAVARVAAEHLRHTLTPSSGVWSGMVPTMLGHVLWTPVHMPYHVLRTHVLRTHVAQLRKWFLLFNIFHIWFHIIIIYLVIHI